VGKRRSLIVSWLKSGEKTSPCAALRARGSWEDAVPQPSWAGERLQQRWEGVWLFSQQRKLILAGKLEVRRARQTSQAEFHSHE